MGHLVASNIDSRGSFVELLESKKLRRVSVYATEILDVTSVWHAIGKMQMRFRNLVVKVIKRTRGMTRNSPNGHLRFDVYLLTQELHVVRLFSSVLRHQTWWTVRESLKARCLDSKVVIRPKAVGVDEEKIEQLRLLSWNVNGINNKSSMIEVALGALAPHVLAIQEHGRSAGGWPLRVGGYEYLTSLKNIRKPGARGVALGVRGVSVCPYGKPSSYWVFGKVYGGHLIQPAVVGSIYLPTKSTQRGLRPRLLKRLRKVLKNLTKRTAKKGFFAALSGDFNMTGAELDRYLFRHNLDFVRLHSEGEIGTFNRKGKRKTDIDHIIVSKGFRINCSEMKIQRDQFASDHFPVMAIIHKVGGRTEAEVPEAKFQKFDTESFAGPKKDVEIMAQIACHNRWASLSNDEQEMDVLVEWPSSHAVRVADENRAPPQDLWESIDNDVDAHNAQFVRSAHVVAGDLNLHKAKRTGKKPVFKLHLTGATLRLLKKKNKLAGRLYRAGLTESEATTMLKKLKKLNKVVKTEVRSERSAAWCKLVRTVMERTGGGGAKAYWRWVKIVMRNTSMSSNSGLEPVQDPETGVLLTDVEDCKKAWHYHYGALATDVYGNSKDRGYWIKLLADQLQCAKLEGLNHMPSWPELCTILAERMKLGKASSEDQIVLEFLKCSVIKNEETKSYPPTPCTPMGRSILGLLSAVWDKREIPHDWLMSVVVSIPKKGDLTDMNNFRGISLMAVMAKVLLTVINVRLGLALEKAGFFIKEQAGFRSGEEAIAQATAMWEVLKRRSLANLPTWLCFIDMSKAFDCVPHEAMLTKLEKAGVHGTCLELIRKIYAGSEFRVRGGYGLTDVIKLQRGVRQGCPLSPLLFDVFINDLLEKNKAQDLGVEVPDIRGKLSALLFADDICLMASSPEELHKLMKNTSDWAAKNGMSFGIKKCAVMGIGVPEEDLENENWILTGKKVEVKTVYTYLGVEFHSDLDLKKSSDARLVVGRKVVSGIRHFLRCWNIPMHTRVMVMKACVLPILLYGAELWGLNVSLTRRHETLINTAIKWILGTSGRGVSSLCMRREIDFTGVAASAAARRTSAFIRWDKKRTWITDLIQTPMTHRKATWVSSTTRWIKKYGQESRWASEAFVSDASPMRHIGEVTEAHLYGESAALIMKCKERARDNTAQFAWYSKYVVNHRDCRKWQKVEMFNPELTRAFTTFARYRIGGIPLGTNLARWDKIDKVYLDTCPFCEQPTKESIEHIVLGCAHWAANRKKISKFVRLAAELTMVGDAVDGDAMLGLLMGGAMVSGPASMGGRSFMTGWFPKEAEKAKENETAEEAALRSRANAVSFNESGLVCMAKFCYEVQGLRVKALLKLGSQWAKRKVLSAKLLLVSHGEQIQQPRCQRELFQVEASELLVD